jgi:hypothetical protein
MLEPLGAGLERAAQKKRVRQMDQTFGVVALLDASVAGRHEVVEGVGPDGGCHDEADAEWIVIGRSLKGHNDTPYRPLGGWPPSGRIWCFQLQLISNVISEHGLPDRGTRLSISGSTSRSIISWL